MKSKKLRDFIISSHKNRIKVIGSDTFKDVIHSSISEEFQSVRKNINNKKLIIIDDLRITKNILLAKNEYKKGDTFADCEFNLIGNKLQLTIKCISIRFESTFRRMLWRLSMQNSLKGKIKEILKTIFNFL